MARPRASGTAGRGLWPDPAVLVETGRRGYEIGRGRDPGSPRPACRGRSLTDRGVTSWEHRPWRYVLLWDHELSRIRRGSSPAVIPAARDIGGNSATTTIRPAPHRGQTRVGVTSTSWPGGVIGSGAGGVTAMPSNSRHRASFSWRWRLASSP